MYKRVSGGLLHSKKIYMTQMEFEHPTELTEKALVCSTQPVYTVSKISVPAAMKNTSHSVQKDQSVKGHSR